MSAEAVKLISPDGTYRVTLDLDAQGQTTCTYSWDESGQEDTMLPSPRPLEELVHWFKSFGWTGDTPGDRDADQPAH